MPPVGLDSLRDEERLEFIAIALSLAALRKLIPWGGLFTVPLAVCPHCEAEIHVDDDLDKGDSVRCEECDSKLEVVGLDPIELDLAIDDKEEDVDEEEGY